MVQIASRKMTRASGQLMKGRRQPARQEHDDGRQEREPAQCQGGLDGGEPPGARHELVLRVERRQRPSRPRADGPEHHTVATAIDVDRRKALLGRLHPAKERRKPLTRLFRPRSRLLEHRRIRMRDDASGSREHDGVAGLAHPHIADERAHPIELEIGRHDTDERLGSGLPQRHGIRHHQRTAAALVQIRLGPARLPGIHGSAVPITLPVPIGRERQIGGQILAWLLEIAIDVRRRVLATRIEGIRLERSGRAVNIGVAGNEAVQQRIK